MSAHAPAHTHAHPHASAPSSELPARRDAAGGVAIEVGPGLGALVLYPSERYRDLEIEISPAESPLARRVHTGVHERATLEGRALTAIFGSLPSGEYVVWTDAETAGPTVTVPEGTFAELQLA